MKYRRDKSRIGRDRPWSIKRLIVQPDYGVMPTMGWMRAVGRRKMIRQKLPITTREMSRSRTTGQKVYVTCHPEIYLGPDGQIPAFQ